MNYTLVSPKIKQNKTLRPLHLFMFKTSHGKEDHFAFIKTAWDCTDAVDARKLNP